MNLRDVHLRLTIQAPERALAVGALLGGFLVSVLVAFISHGTYDSGDSINHYLFAHYAPQHPTNLLDAWAKPLFTTLAMLPAQAGFKGIKLFQCLLMAAAAWSAYVVARRLELSFPFLAIVFCYAAPDWFRIQLSGLTEPLFGCILAGSVGLAASNRPAAAAALISWLPLVRSEGVLLVGIWGVYLLWSGQWRALPWLGLGIGFYSLVGALVLGDIGWLFTKNPYSFHSQYGSGHWSHFFNHMPTLLGWPLTILTYMGLLLVLARAVRPAQWSQPDFRLLFLLVSGSVVAFVGAHTVFWALGLFGSFGMTRVLTVVGPLCAILALVALTWLTNFIASTQRRQLALLGAGLLIVAHLALPDYGYTTPSGSLVGYHGNLHWERDFLMTTDMELAARGGEWLKTHDPGWRWHPLAYEHYYFPFYLDSDPFDVSVRQSLRHSSEQAALESLPVGTYVYWDSWFAPVEGHLQLATLEKHPNFRKRWQASAPQYREYPEWLQIQAAIFEKVQ